MDLQISPSAMFDKLDKLTSRLSNQKSKQHAQHQPRDDEDEDFDNQLQMIEVVLNTSKHPPAELPPPPVGLTPLQVLSIYL
jgi:hypothetical protein